MDVGNIHKYGISSRCVDIKFTAVACWIILVNAAASLIAAGHAASQSRATLLFTAGIVFKALQLILIAGGKSSTLNSVVH